MNKVERKSWLYCLLFPPVFSFIFSFIILLSRRNKICLYRFLFCTVVIIAYWYVAYDTILKFFSYVSLKEINIDSDPLTIVMYLLKPIDYYFIIFIYWLISGYFFYSIHASYYKKKIPITALILMICSLNFAYWANLTYFTLALNYSLYIGFKFRKKILYIILSSLLVFLFHGGAYMIMFPAILLFYLWKCNYIKLSVLYIALFFILTYMFANHKLNIDVYLDFLLTTKEQRDSYDGYVGDTEWGTSVRDFGIRGYIYIYILYLIAAITIYYLIRYFRLVKKNFAGAFMVISIIIFYNMRNFYTISERSAIGVLLSTSIVVAFLFSRRCISKFIRILYLGLISFSFIFSAIFFVQPREDMFVNESYGYDVSVKSLCIPTFLCVLDIHHFGFSNEYLKNNARNRHK